VVAGVIHELNLVDQIDARLDGTGESKVSTGQAIAAMIINCLGFTGKPLSLTPHFFQSKAMDVLFGEGVEAEDMNRQRNISGFNSNTYVINLLDVSRMLK